MGHEQALPSGVGNEMISSSEPAISPSLPSTKYEDSILASTGVVVSSSSDSARPSPTSPSSPSQHLHAPLQPQKSQVVLADEVDGNSTERDPTSLTHNDASRCPHLEECMFPRFLSLDCKQMDDFCLGCVEDNPNVKRLGRIYIEALHLQAFLKDPHTIELEKKRSSSMKGNGKGLSREPRPLPLSKTKRSSPSPSPTNHQKLRKPTMNCLIFRRHTWVGWKEKRLGSVTLIMISKIEGRYWDYWVILLLTKMLNVGRPCQRQMNC